MVSEFNKRLEELDVFLEQAWTLPFVNDKYIVNGEQLRGIIEAIKLSLPSELKKAKEVLDTQDKTSARANEEAEITLNRAKKNADQMLAKAKKTATEIIENARAEAEELVNEQEIIAIANDRAEKIVEQAKQDAIKMRDITLNYIDSVITEGEKSLGNALGTLNQLKQSYSNNSKTEQ